jgi:hypothetical protein
MIFLLFSMNLQRTVLKLHLKEKSKLRKAKQALRPNWAFALLLSSPAKEQGETHADRWGPAIIDAEQGRGTRRRLLAPARFPVNPRSSSSPPQPDRPKEVQYGGRKVTRARSPSIMAAAVA